MGRTRRPAMERRNQRPHVHPEELQALRRGQVVPRGPDRPT